MGRMTLEEALDEVVLMILVETCDLEFTDTCK